MDAGVEVGIECHFGEYVAAIPEEVGIKSSLLRANSEGEVMLKPGKDEGFQDSG